MCSRYEKKLAIVLFVPIVALPLFHVNEDPLVGRTAWAGAVISIYWATEVIPIAVTSLLPMVLFPALGVMSADRTSRNYFTDKIVLFFGGLVIAAALEVVQLQKRIALRVLLVFGAQPTRLLLGFMCATAFISMWMSNTATAAMMMPIAEAVLQHLGSTTPPAQSANQVTPLQSVGLTNLGKALVLSIAYSADIGGLATLTGTGPNLILAGDFTSMCAVAHGCPLAFRPHLPLLPHLHLTLPTHCCDVTRCRYPDGPGVSFAMWMAFGLPLSVLLLLCTWRLLILLLLHNAEVEYDPSSVTEQLR